jgi:hypothetical protein
MIQRSLPILLGLLAVVAVGAAAQPNAPVLAQIIINSGGGSGGGGEEPGGDDRFTISDALSGAGFGVAPTEPTITSGPTTVTNATLAANKVAGRELYLSTDTYGNETFNVNNQRIVVQAGSTFGEVSFSGSFIEFYCEDVRDCDTGKFNFSGDHITVDGFSALQAGSADTNSVHAEQTASNIAILNSRIEMGSYCFYGDVGASNITIGNTELITTGESLDACIRFMSASTVVLKHLRIVNPIAQILRHHADDIPSSNHHVEDVQLEGWGPGQIQPDSDGGGAVSTLANILYTNVDYYADGGGANWGSMGSVGQRVDNLDFVDVRMFSTGGACPSELEANWDIDCTVLSTTTAPAWSYL